MKHAASTTQSAAKPKAKTLTKAKAIEKTKPVAKKTLGKIVVKSGQPTSAHKVAVAAKPTIKKNAVKISAKVSDTPKPLAARKAKRTVEQTEPVRAKKIAPKTSAKSLKASAEKTKLISSTKKVVEKTERKTKNITTAQKAKSEITTAKLKVAVKPIIRSSIKSAKSQPLKAVVQKVKARQPKVKIAVPAAKFRPTKIAAAVETKTQSVNRRAQPVAASNSPQLIVKSKPTDAARSVARVKTIAKISAEKNNRQPKEIQPVVSANKAVKPTKKINPITAPTAIKKTIKMKPAATVKKADEKTRKSNLTPPAAPVGNPDSKVERIVSSKTVEAAENPIETPARAPKPKNRKAKPICSAVFRGKKERYDFKVFALDEIFEPIPAVYIISKRKTDKRKKGHHALICIGETISIADEVKRHRKGKCVKKHEANVVSILPEADAKARLKIETDLKAAHTVVCNLD